MVQILCKEDARLAPSTLDAPHVDGAPNYTIDALMQLAVEWPDADLFAIVGADSLQQLPRWREASRLFDLASWIVVSRPEHAFRDGLPPLLRHAQEQGRLYLLGGVNMPISSTVLRRQLHEGVEPQSDALSEEVQRYIQTHALYSGGTKTGEAADL